MSKRLRDGVMCFRLKVNDEDSLKSRVMVMVMDRIRDVLG